MLVGIYKKKKGGGRGELLRDGDIAHLFLFCFFFFCLFFFFLKSSATPKDGSPTKEYFLLLFFLPFAIEIMGAVVVEICVMLFFKGGRI